MCIIKNYYIIFKILFSQYLFFNLNCYFFLCFMCESESYNPQLAEWLLRTCFLNGTFSLFILITNIDWFFLSFSLGFPVHIFCFSSYMKAFFKNISSLVADCWLRWENLSETVIISFSIAFIVSWILFSFRVLWRYYFAVFYLYF